MASPHAVAAALVLILFGKSAILLMQRAVVLHSPPLGHPVPQSPHAVCCSLPTLQDVIGYEEKVPAVMQAMRSGYPRFFLHPYLKRLAECYRSRLGIASDAQLFLVSSPVAAADLVRFAGFDGSVFTEDGLAIVAASGDGDSLQRASQFIQHTGCGVSTRQAESLLIAHGGEQEVFGEIRADGTQEDDLVAYLRSLAGIRDDAPAVLARSGMSAFYAVFRVLRRHQLRRNRRIWIQLGWLYLDTMRILERLLGDDEEHVKFFQPDSLGELAAYLATCGHEVAGIVTETPTNPLMETVDVDGLRKLADQHDIPVILDPSSSGLLNVDVLPHADFVVSSLTKYIAHEGDVMAGLIVVNPDSKWAEPVCAEIFGLVERLYPADIDRLAVQARSAVEVTDRINANACIVAGWLEAHPAVRRVFWPLAKGQARNYQRVSRRPSAPGSLITIELNGPLARFYDAVDLVKGPSFGTRFTLLCPFMWLAHYDLVTNEVGRAYLRSSGVDPDLIRFSIGTEDPDAIISRIGAALEL